MTGKATRLSAKAMRQVPLDASVTGQDNGSTAPTLGDLPGGQACSAVITESSVGQTPRTPRRFNPHQTGRAKMSVVSRLLGAAIAAIAASINPTVNIAVASAASCPDIEVVFARGTFEPSGVGTTGEAFVNALRSRTGGKSVEVYPVNYPASLDFQTAADGVVDASNKVHDIAVSCPSTKMVLGGYSQGAAVIGYITVDAIPAGFTAPAGITGPLPPWVADHVAAVALFGKPSRGFLQTFAATAPPIAIGHLYSAKTIDLCTTGDPICAPGGDDNGAHGLYAVNGMTDQAADFATRGLASGALLTHA